MRLKHMALPSSGLLVSLLGLLVGLAVVLAGVSTHAHAHPALNLTVSNCSFEFGPGALGNVIAGAPAGATINFSCSGTIPIISTLTISKNLKLDGTGQTVTLDGFGTTGILVVNSGINFALNDLTVAHGFFSPGGGGGLHNNGGTVNISNSTFSNNSANANGGGLLSIGGTVNISNSTFSNNSAALNGGGLDSCCGTVVNIGTSTFSNNSADSGGGGLVTGEDSVSITHSTFSNNSAVNGCGALVLSSSGNIGNSTFSNNSSAAGSGGICTEGTGTITFSTIANNSGPTGGNGIDNFGTLNIEASIVANNSGGNCAGSSLSDQGNNLESATDCGFTGTGDLQNTNPQLSPLANNGGPTQTLALTPASSAIDHVPAAMCTGIDQRGFPRGTGSNHEPCDIGAYEFQDPLAPVLTNLPGTITVNATSPQGAVVTYTPPTATDDEAVMVTCTPPSGSTFHIGDTTVTCTAHDAVGNTTTGSFLVHVRGAMGQMQELINLVNSFHLDHGLQHSLDVKVHHALDDVNSGDITPACNLMGAFLNEVQAQSGKMLMMSQADQLIAAAKQIQAVLGC